MKVKPWTGCSSYQPPQELDTVARTGKNQTALGTNLSPTACWLSYLGELLYPSEVFLKKQPPPQFQLLATFGSHMLTV